MNEPNPQPQMVVVPLSALNEFLDRLVPYNLYGQGDANVANAVTKFCQAIASVSPDSLPNIKLHSEPNA